MKYSPPHGTPLFFVLRYFCTAHAQILVVTSCKCSATMLNFCVYNKSNHKTVVPWRIHGVSPPDVTFRGFYSHEASRFIEGGSHSAAQLELHYTVLSRCYAPFVVTPPSPPPPPSSARSLILLRVTFCSLIRPPTYTCTHVFGLLLPQCLL